ncbi:hypothetical protein [Thomasclavelia cocleata]|uniref:hypothetical protein n=1 Tax=Thomasclavelia cocleata TaxID=69824 RepID=UPI002570126B|nr:hypothetical protein [Thomasclavelia cocleata]
MKKKEIIKQIKIEELKYYKNNNYYNMITSFLYMMSKKKLKQIKEVWCRGYGKNNYCINLVWRNGEIDQTEYHLQTSIKNKKIIDVDLLRDMKF